MAYTRYSYAVARKNQPGFTAAKDSEWQWHQLGHMQICTSPQTDNHTSTLLGSPSCRPTNSIKALKAVKCQQDIINSQVIRLHLNQCPQMRSRAVTKLFHNQTLATVKAWSLSSCCIRQTEHSIGCAQRCNIIIYIYFYNSVSLLHWTHQDHNIYTVLFTDWGKGLRKRRIFGMKCSIWWAVYLRMKWLS